MNGKLVRDYTGRSISTDIREVPRSGRIQYKLLALCYYGAGAKNFYNRELEVGNSKNGTAASGWDLGSHDESRSEMIEMTQLVSCAEISTESS